MKDNHRIILQDGFLDLKLNAIITAFRQEHNAEYAVVFKIKSFLDEAQDCFVRKKVSKQDMFLSASIMELNKLFQSAVLLFERGLPSSANIIVRSILELSFKIIELIKNENFLQEMIMDINSETLKTLNNIKNEKLYELMPQDRLEQLLEDCQQKKSQSGNVNIGAYNLADRNGLKKEYILYRTYCGYTHQSLSSIDEFIETTPQGVTLDGDLRLADFSESLALLISITMISCPYIAQHSLICEKMKNQFDLLHDDFVKTFKKE